MKQRKIQRKFHKLLSFGMIVCILLTLSIPTAETVVYAGTGTKAADAATDLKTLSSGATLSSGVYYLSESKTFGASSTMNNGLKIASGATVYLYVPEGVTLTAIGGGTNAVRQAGGYAGILLPSNSKLIILGEGKVVATGGRAGNGASGSSGNNGFITWDGEDRYYGGGGGAGGYGGGGAGAGIGTNGGSGGSGGSATGNGATKYNGDENYDGASGNSGNKGNTASACGTLYAQATISLTATGGLGGTAGGSGGANGSNEWEGSNDDDKWDGKQYHTAGGGGGGGGGGAGYSAYGIGTGGAGGGGGGSGGQGGTDYTKNTDHDGPKTNASCSAAGGNGGSGYYSGSVGYGTRDTGTYDGSWTKVGGTGGLGGSTGSGSTSKSALSSGWTDKTFTVSFAGVNGESIQQTTYTFGEATTTIPVPAYPYTPEDGFRFSGWYISAYGTSPAVGTRLTGTDTKVYQPGESIEAGAWLAGSIVLKPVISEIDCKVCFNDNGGSGGAVETLLKSDMTIQPSVTVPTRVGYDFCGYYTGMVKGTRYYDENGNRVYMAPVPNTKTDLTLYAQWTIHSSTLTIDPNGGVYDGETTFTRKYGDSVTVGVPVDTSGEGKTFLRWVLFDSEGTASDNGTLYKGAGYTTFVFGPETTAVTLKAIWSSNDTSVVVDQHLEGTISGENMDRIFQHNVEDTTKGLTAEELIAEEKEVVLTVEEIAVATEANETRVESVNSIETMLEETSYEALNYYDISVKKIIKETAESEEVVTILKELPETVKITIELTEDLRGRNGYSVYRVHEGVAERMSSSRGSTEFFEVIGDSIVIHTKKFSTYAITASNSVIGEYPKAELNATNNFAATDVQGMYVDSSSTKVYKVDVEWGAMKFDFHKHQKWNPEGHVYEDEIKVVLDKDAHLATNNEIVVTNHSNADVRVGFALAEKNLDGVEISIRQLNDDTSDVAVDMELEKVSDASGNGIVDNVNAFVRLTGVPNETSLAAMTTNTTRGIYQKVATVVITIEAITDSPTTPLYLGSGD